MLKQRYGNARTFPAMLASADSNRTLWRTVHERVRLPAEAVERARALPGRWHLLVLSEDWCGDAVNTVPVIARLAEAVPNLDLRILGRDANPDLMDAHRTNGSRSIPVVMVLDEHFQEHGWWGPRPAELQAWVLEEGLALPSDERYRRIRRWYARDRGVTTLAEVLDLLEEAAGDQAAA